METLQEFITRTGLEMELNRIPRRTDGFGWGGANHYTVTISRQGEEYKLITQFSTGSAWTTDPTIADMLESIQSDIAGVKSTRSISEYQREYSFSSFAEAKRVRDVILTQGATLKLILGSKEFKHFMDASV